MVMDGEREECEDGGCGGGGGGRGGGGVGEDNVEGLIHSLEVVIESAARLGEFRRTQRKECYTLLKRMKLLLPLFEEVKELEGLVPEDGVVWMASLKKVLIMAKKLLKFCHDGSKIYLAIESEAVMVRFHTVHHKLTLALDGLPEELCISDEVREQIDLMVKQLKRARKRTDTQDIELAMDIMVVLSEKDDDRNADSAIVERLAQKLELHTAEDLKIETVSIRNLVKEKGGISAEACQQLIDLLNKFRLLAGMEVTDVVDEPVIPKILKCPSLVIPPEFLCPVTLEVMTDPVIVASGQSYDRESIQKWFDTNHATCPITREILPHQSLAPNYALKALIEQWSEKHNFKLPVKEASSCEQESSSTEQKDEILSLVEELSSSQLDVQRKAAMKIRLLSKENPENRVLIAQCGGIRPLVQLLSYPDSKIQQHAVTALLNLSIDETNKKIITREEAIPAIIEVLQTGSTEARENSAAALFSLSMLDENKVRVGLSDGIPPLVELLQSGTIRGKKDAATALFNLSLTQANKARAISAGIVPPLLKVLNDRNLGMVDEALSIFLLLASHPDGRQEIGQLSFIETLVEFIREGTPKNKECATSVLLELGSNNSNFLLASLQYGVYEHLDELTKSGTNRAQRKAKAVLQLISKSEHV